MAASLPCPRGRRPEESRLLQSCHSPGASDGHARQSRADAVRAASTRALAAVNTAIIELSWQIGEHISRKVERDGWGQSTVDALAAHIHRHQPNARGFSASNL